MPTCSHHDQRFLIGRGKYRRSGPALLDKELDCQAGQCTDLQFGDTGQPSYRSIAPRPIVLTRVHLRRADPIRRVGCMHHLQRHGKDQGLFCRPTKRGASARRIIDANDHTASLHHRWRPTCRAKHRSIRSVAAIRTSNVRVHRSPRFALGAWTEASASATAEYPGLIVAFYIGPQELRRRRRGLAGCLVRTAGQTDRPVACRRSIEVRRRR